MNDVCYIDISWIRFDREQPAKEDYWDDFFVFGYLTRDGRRYRVNRPPCRVMLAEWREWQFVTMDEYAEPVTALWWSRDWPSAPKEEAAR